MSDYIDLPVIDAHMHIMDDFSKDPRSIMETIRDMHERNNLKACNLLSIPSIDDQQILQNLLCILYKALHNDDTYAFGGLDYNLPGLGKETFDFRGQCMRFMEMGFDGIKFIESKPIVRKSIGNMPFTAEPYKSMFMYLEEKSIPILWHAADPETFWHADLIPDWAEQRGMFYGDGRYIEKEAIYQEVDEILNRHPGLRIVFAHLYFLSADLERADRFLSKWPRIRFDVTPGVEMYENFASRSDEWKDFFNKYQDQIVFGTDCGVDIEGEPSAAAMVEFARQKTNWVRKFLEGREAFEMFRIKTRGIGLARNVLEKIYATNFIKLASAKPKVVDIPAAIDFCNDRKAAFGNSALTDHKEKLLGRIRSIEKEMVSCNR